MNIGKAIKEIREHKGLTQEQLADRVGGTAEGLDKIETGATQPEPGVVEVIASALGVPMEILRIMGLEKEDVAPEKQLIFEVLFPIVKDMIKMISHKPESLASLRERLKKEGLDDIESRLKQ